MEPECCALTGHGLRPLLLRRRASRPQLKRDPLGGLDPRSEGVMTNHRAAFLLSVLLVLSGSVACHPVNTMPPPPSPSDPVEHYDLEIPAVSFDATAFSGVSGAGNVTSTQIGGRAFLKVYAVHRQTGEQYLLIYEDIAHRKTPIQVIRFRPVPDARVLAP